MIESPWPRRLSAGLIALLMVAYLLPYASTMLSADSVRDLSMAWQLYAHGEWPAQGPDIFSRYTLGPIWFWLLAAVMALSPSLTALVMLIGAIASLKFPLAYLLARRIGGELVGVVCCAMLALSSISLIEHWTFAHTNLVVLCSLCVFWFGALLHEQPTDRRWLGFAVALLLAVHAHPSAALSALAAAPAWWRHRRHAISPAAVVAALTILLLGLLPTLWFASNGSLWYANANAGLPLTPIVDWPLRSALLWARIVLDPLRVLVETLGLARAGWLGAIGIVLATGGVVASLTIARRALAWPVFVASVFGVVALVAVRATTPLWMALALLPFSSLLVALGWGALCARLPRATAALVAALFVAFALTSNALWLRSRIDAGASGEQRLPQRRVANLALPGDDAQRTQPQLGVHALDRVARRFCADFPHTPLFGDIVLGVATAEALPFLLRDCPPERWPLLGGDGGEAVAGLVRGSGAQQAEGWPRIDGYAFVPVRRVLYPLVGIALRERPPYPPIAWFGREPRALRFDVQLVADEILAFGSRFRFEPETTVAIAPGDVLAVREGSSLTRLYRCRDGRDCSFTLELRTVIPEALQLYTLDASAFTRTDRAE